MTSELPQLDKLTRDLRKGGELTMQSARYFVDQYYAIQDFRIQANNQIRAAIEVNEPVETIEWMASQFETLESQVKVTLGNWAQNYVPGRWARSILGIGPVLSAGLLAHIDIEKAPYAGHIWSFAGIIPGVEWKKGERRPWNAKLKVLCWKIGDSFVKVSGRPNDVYGKIYRARKALEVERDTKGLFADQAQETLDTRNIKDPATLAVYRAGHLPLGRLDLRARRYAVRIFLAHYHHVAYEDHYKQSPPRPYILDEKGGHHTHYLAPPNWPMAEE
jgi:hypothetical protein